MKPRVGIIIAAALIVVLLSLATLLPKHDGSGTREQVWRGWPGAAAHRPYALAQDFLRERGTELELADRPRGAFPPPDKDALLLENNGADLSETQQTRLHEWVAAGGLLVLESGHAAGEAFGLKWQTLEEKSDGFTWRTRDGSTLHITTPVARRIDYSGTATTHKDADGNTVALELAVGRGRVVALGHDFGLWANRAAFAYPGQTAKDAPVPLAQGDNAAYLHDLLQQHKQALLIQGGLPGERPPWHWPGARWWPLLATAALALIALLYYHGRRFGTLLLPPAGAARDIARHLRAAGGYWADNRDGYTFLGEQVQMRLAADLAAGQHHYPDRAAQLADLADKSGISAATIETLLTAQVPSDEPEFTAYMTAIARLRSTM